MSALVFLILGLVCALTSRVLLVSAAFGVSTWWAIGVFLPFGPLLFRLNYPDLVQSAAIVRFATIPCLLLYFILGSPFHRSHLRDVGRTTATPAAYALERRGGPDQKSKSGGPAVRLQPSIEERKVANFQEFQRLQAWSEALKLRKRDLLHSDTEGNRAYEVELAQYNAALARANTEKEALAHLNK
jgi:hypothetical protein